MFGLLTRFLRQPSKFGSNTTRGGNISPKMVPRGRYKGRQVRPVGIHTKKGGYLVMRKKLLYFKVPDLSETALKAYVSKNTPKISVSPPEVPKNEKLASLRKSVWHLENVVRWKKQQVTELSRRITEMAKENTPQTKQYQPTTESNSAKIST